MQLDLSCVLPCDLATAREALLKPAGMRRVAWPLVTFEGDLPQQWSEGTYWAKLRLFGLLPMGSQAIVISFPEHSGFALRDNGYSRLIPVWDHLITVEHTAQGLRYRDRLTFKAGVLTPLVWLFVRVFFRHRQRRLRRLLVP